MRTAFFCAFPHKSLFLQDTCEKPINHMNKYEAPAAEVIVLGPYEAVCLLYPTPTESITNEGEEPWES